MSKLFLMSLLALSVSSFASNIPGDYIVKFKNHPVGVESHTLSMLKNSDVNLEKLDNDMYRLRVPNAGNLESMVVLNDLNNQSDIEYIQPNYILRIPNYFNRLDNISRQMIIDEVMRGGMFSIFNDHQVQPKKADPEIPSRPADGRPGIDPKLGSQWGMKRAKATDAWTRNQGDRKVIVAVIDTGVDYTHQDLVENMWRNPGEIPGNGIDDDHNGFIDDVVGWDFASNDNKPFDITVDPMQIIVGGGNPGHGTHCAGNVGATGNNSLGISGVSQKVSIMALRFLTEKGEGTTADAVKAIKYALDNGATVLSNSWGSEGEDPNDGVQNKALRDIIQQAQDKGTLFIAAAGNGHNGVGYDNDTDANPGYPASYDTENIISVAATDINGKLGSFSNWGIKSVDIGAPGVDIYSTVPGNKYTNVVVDTMGMKVTWDGTSMATPHVAGAAALVWSAHPNYTWKQVKNALLKGVTPDPSLRGKVVSEGELNVQSALQN